MGYLSNTPGGGGGGTIGGSLATDEIGYGSAANTITGDMLFERNHTTFQTYLAKNTAVNVNSAFELGTFGIHGPLTLNGALTTLVNSVSGNKYFVGVGDMSSLGQPTESSVFGFRDATNQTAAIFANLNGGDPNIFIQTYPAGGITQGIQFNQNTLGARWQKNGHSLLTFDVGGYYDIGDASGALGNATHLELDDFNRTAKIFGSQGTRLLIDNTANELYQFGDIDGMNNGSFISIDDAAETISLNKDTTITGKLTVTGLIDPTAVILSDPAVGTDLYFESNDGQTAGLSGASTGRIRYNDALARWEQSIQGGAYGPFGGGGGSPGGAVNNIQTNDGVGGFYGDANFIYDPAGQLFQLYGGGNELLIANGVLGVFQLGFSSGGNGTGLQIYDQNYIKFTAGSGNRFLYDVATKTYAFGDIDGQDNNNIITVDDDNNFFQYTRNGNQYLSANTQAGRYGIGDLDLVAFNTYFGLNDLTAGVNISGYRSVTGGQSTVAFGGSGLDDLTVSGTYTQSGLINWTIIVASVDAQSLSMTTIVGPGFIVGETVTQTTGAGAGTTGIITLIHGGTIFVDTIVPSGGGFAIGETIDNSVGTTGFLVNVSAPFDTFNWTDGITTEFQIPMTGAPVLLSYGVSITNAATGHTVADQWTFNFDQTFGNMLSFDGSNNHTFSIGDVDDIYLGTKLKIDDANRKVTILTNAGNKMFDVDDFGGLYGIGDLTGAHNGSAAWVSDSGEALYLGPNPVNNQTVHPMGFGPTPLSSGLVTDTAGATLQIFGGQSTGAGDGGSIIFATSKASGTGNNVNGLNNALEIDTNGNLRAFELHNNATAQGNTSQQDIRSGTYTPTLTGVANVAASTAYQCQWLRVGNVVTVSGKVDIDPTLATTLTQLGISLPVASNIGANEDCAGTGNSVRGLTGASILGDAANDRAQLEYTATTVISNESWYFTFTYEVL